MMTLKIISYQVAACSWKRPVVVSVTMVMIIATGLNITTPRGWAQEQPVPTQVEIFDKVVAGVGDEPILLSEIEKKMTLGPLILVHDYPATAKSSVYERALHDAINFAIIKEQAEQLEITVSTEEVATQMTAILAAQQATHDDLEAYLLSQGLSLASYKADLNQQILIQKFQSRVIAPNMRLSDQRIRETYQKKFNTSPYDERISFVQVRLVLPGGSDQELKDTATELYQQVKTSDGVADLMAQQLTGWHERVVLSGERQVYISELTDNIAAVVAGMKPMTISQPTKVGQHWSLLILTARKSVVKPHFEAQKMGLLQQLRIADIGDSLKNWLASERGKRKIFVSTYRPTS